MRKKQYLPKLTLLSRTLPALIPLILVGCDTSWKNFGSGVGGSSGAQSTRYASKDQSSYKGSQAYNSSLFSGEDVNAQTGDLNLSRSLISAPGVLGDIDLNLTYSSDNNSKAGILGLPVGWSYQLSYVVPNKSVNINGSNYIIDSTWRDSSGYSSGLKYMNNHGIHFTTVLPDQALPFDNKRYYRYIYTSDGGTHQYFDATGKLIAQADRFGNHISYYYYDYGSISSSRLKEIVDSYGQKYVFGYGTDNVSITGPSGNIISQFGFSSTGVLWFQDALKLRTSYSYATFNKVSVINQIRYPSGLSAVINYTSLPYLVCGGAKGTLPAVLSIKHIDGKLLDQTTYSYGAGSGGSDSNFTGYGAGYCMGSDKDTLEDSNNYGYLYSVTITKAGDATGPAQSSRVYYNFLHLPVRQETLDRSGAVHKQTLYSYDISPQKIVRSASYGSPISVITKSAGMVISEVHSSYDEHNQLLQSTQSVAVGGHLVKYLSSSNSYFSDAWYLPASTLKKDEVNGSSVGSINTLSSDGKNIASSITNYNGSPWTKSSFSYDGLGRLTNETLAWASGGHSGVGSTNNSYSYSYTDGKLRIVKTDALGHASTSVSSTTLPGGPLLQQISPEGKSSSISYDAGGRELSVTSPMKHSITSSYTVGSGNNKVITTDANGYTQTVIYDGLGRPLSASDNGSGSSRLLQSNSYSLNGQISTTTDMLGNSTSYKYDEYGRVVQSKDALNNVATIGYNDKGLSVHSLINGTPVSDEVKDGAGNTLSQSSYSGGSSQSSSASYDGFGRKTKSNSTTNGAIMYNSSYSYDGSGNIVSSNTNGYDGINVSSSSSYDLLGNTLSSSMTIAGLGSHSSRSNTYNAVGQLTSVKNQLGQSKSLSYNKDGELISVKDYDGSTFSYSYDADGNQLSSSHNGITTSNSYDVVGNLLSTTNPEGTIKYSYTKTGRLTSANYPGGMIVGYSYDGHDLLTGKNSAVGMSTSYSHDKYGRVTGISTPQSNISYSYQDGALTNGKYGALGGVNLTDGGKSITKHSYTYGDWDAITQDAIIQGAHKITIGYAFDKRQKLINQTISSDLKDSSLNMEKVFSYNSLSQLLNSTALYHEESGTTTKVSEAYKYDINGNILSHIKDGITTTYQYNAIDQLTAVDKVTISYDKAGNLLKDPDGNEYSYNGLNQLTAVKYGKSLTNYSYYPDGLLRNKQSVGSNLSFYYDSGHADGIDATINGVRTKDSFLLSGSGTPVASYRNNIANYYLKAGNSTVGMLNSNSELVNSYKYQDYGTVKGTKATDPAQSFLWNQEYQDQDTGLVYLRARFYNPKLMRFMNADTMDLSNLYAFGNGDPINNMDPSGNFSVMDGVALGVGVAGSIGATALAVATFGAATPVAAAAWTSAVSAIAATGADVGRIAAQETGDTKTASALGYASMALSAVSAVSGVGTAAGMTATKAGAAAEAGGEAIELTDLAATGTKSACFTGDTEILMASTESGNMSSIQSSRKAISKVKVGDLVETGDDNILDEVAKSSDKWQQADLQYKQKVDGKDYIVKITLLRPESYFTENKVENVGDKLTVNLPEMGLDNVAMKVISLKPFKGIQMKESNTSVYRQIDEVNWDNNPKRPVTATFARYAKEVYTYKFRDSKTGEISTINATPNHPFYVLNKHDYVSISKVTADDELLSEAGDKVKLVCLDNQHSNCGVKYNKDNKPTLVYNFEIYQQHRYFVGDDGSKQLILIHNNCLFDTAKHAVEETNKLIPLENSTTWRIANGRSTVDSSYFELVDTNKSIAKLKTWNDKVKYALERKTGNCEIMSDVCAAILRKNGFGGAIRKISYYDHAFLRLTSGEEVVYADPWRGVVFKNSTEIMGYGQSGTLLDNGDFLLKDGVIPWFHNENLVVQTRIQIPRTIDFSLIGLH